MSCDVSRLRYRGGFVPHHLAHHLGGRRRLLRSSMSSPLYRLIACVPSIISCRRLVIQFPRLAVCLARRLCPIRHLSCHLGQFCLRPAFRFAPRPVLPWVMSSPPCLIAPRAVRLAAIDRPALLVAWLGAGRDGEPLSPSPARLAVAACSGMASRLRAFPCCGLLACVPPFVSVLWRRNCIYDLSRCYNIM